MAGCLGCHQLTDDFRRRVDELSSGRGMSSLGAIVSASPSDRERPVLPQTWHRTLVTSLATTSMAFPRKRVVQRFTSRLRGNALSVPHIARQIEHDVPGAAAGYCLGKEGGRATRLRQVEESSRRWIEDRPPSRQSAWRLPGIRIGVAGMAESPATAAPCGLIQLGEVTLGGRCRDFGIRVRGTDGGRATDPCPGSGQPARGSGPVSGSAARALWLAAARSAGGERE